ncbi:MAG: hypothetical protein IBJ11_07635 [Phycisphaerales bacterium]|nr:hypothetical protein [Phycisphaerales bacterium]
MSYRALAASAAAVLVAAAGASAAVPTTGNLVVLRAGDGSASLNTSSVDTFLQEFTPAGSLVQTQNISGFAGNTLRVQGSSSSEGFITYVNGWLTVAGYDVAAGVASPSGATAAANRRILSFVGDLNNPSVSISQPNSVLHTSNAFRSAVTADGNSFYTSGGTQGTFYFATPTTAPTLVQSSITNSRVVNIQTFATTTPGVPQTRLMVSSATTGLNGVGAFPGSPPTAASSISVFGSNSVSGSPFSTGSNYAFAVSPDGLTMYIADDGNNTAGIHKLTRSLALSSGGWTYAYTFRTNTSGGNTFSARGLAVDWTGTSPVIYATTAETSANRLISIVDSVSTFTTGSVGTTTGVRINDQLPTLVATADANTAFRGVVFIPTPGVLGLAGVAGLVGLRRRR